MQAETFLKHLRELVQTEPHATYSRPHARSAASFAMQHPRFWASWSSSEVEPVVPLDRDGWAEVPDDTGRVLPRLVHAIRQYAHHDRIVWEALLSGARVGGPGRDDKSIGGLAERWLCTAWPGWGGDGTAPFVVEGRYSSVDEGQSWTHRGGLRAEDLGDPVQVQIIEEPLSAGAMDGWGETLGWEYV